MRIGVSADRMEIMVSRQACCLINAIYNSFSTHNRIGGKIGTAHVCKALSKKIYILKI
jgi:hypothetical protein